VITVVSGLPRSGTSLMMQMLAAGGMPLLTDGEREADADNPRGYFEYEKVKQLRTDSSWVREAEGKAVKVIHVLLTALPPGFEYRVLMMQRPLEQVLASQRAMLLHRGKEPGDDTVLAAGYQRQLTQVMQFLNDSPNFSWIPVGFEEVLRTPMEQAGAVAAFVGGGLDVAAMAQTIDPDLSRHRNTRT